MKTIQDLQALRQRVMELQGEAEAATRKYERTAWLRYGAIWIPIPFIVLILRHELVAWHYYVVGVLFLAAFAVMYGMDAAAVARRDKAIQEAEHAQEIYDNALRMSERDISRIET